VELWTGHGQALAEGPVRVKAQALGIGYGHQEQREGTGLMAERIDIALTDQALIDPTALPGHWAELGERDKSLLKNP
jgi:hypothetical protein